MKKIVENKATRFGCVLKPIISKCLRNSKIISTLEGTYLVRNAHEPTSELLHPNTVHTSAVARTFLKNTASPSEYTTHSSLSQASFDRECEWHIQ